MFIGSILKLILWKTTQLFIGFVKYLVKKKETIISFWEPKLDMPLLQLS
jgi:hypothetical protein